MELFGKLRLCKLNTMQQFYAARQLTNVERFLMKKQEPPKSLVLGSAGAVIAGPALLILIANGENVAALLMAISFIFAFPPFEAMLLRYGLNNEKRLWGCIAAAALSCAFALQSVDNDERQGSNLTVVESLEDSALPVAEENMRQSSSSSLDVVEGCEATDGDTLRCGDERIRLLGIDAPEMGGCEIVRACVQGDPIKSRDMLQFVLKDTMELERVGRDKYQRTLALVYIDGVSLSCHQLGLQNAVYVAEWDDGQRISSECASAAFRQAQEF